MKPQLIPCPICHTKVSFKGLARHALRRHNTVLIPEKPTHPQSVTPQEEPKTWGIPGNSTVSDAFLSSSSMPLVD